MDLDQKALQALAKMFTIASNLPPDQFERLQKDTMPSAGRPITGHLYDGGPFSLIDTDIYSLNISDSSPITAWIPTRGVNWLKDEVQHMAWGAFPSSFDGSQTYKDWLSTIVIDKCGYGPAGTNWDGFRYRVDGGSFSFTSDMMTVIEDSGVKMFEQQPIYNIRGGNGAINGVIANDKDWAIAQLLQIAREHVDYINIYGERANSDMEWDGLSTVINTGYVASHVVGISASAALADPLIANGLTLGVPADPGLVLKLLDSMIRNRLNYARQRGWTIQTSDMTLLMNPTHLEMLQQAQAAGAMNYWVNYFGTPAQMTQTVDGYQAAYERARAQRTLRLGDRDIPVIEDVNLGWQSVVDTAGADVTAVTADIFFLVRRINGQNVLENLFIDWTTLDYPFKNTDMRALINGGIARTGWVEEASKCYYYFLEMYGRLVCRNMPMQARLNGVTMVPNNALDLLEQTKFWAPDNAAYNGVQGGHGTPILVGQRLD